MDEAPRRTSSPGDESGGWGRSPWSISSPSGVTGGAEVVRSSIAPLSDDLAAEGQRGRPTARRCARVYRGRCRRAGRRRDARLLALGQRPLATRVGAVDGLLLERRQPALVVE